MDIGKAISVQKLLKSLNKNKPRCKLSELTRVLVYVLCHDGNENEADIFCNRMNTNSACYYKKHKLRQSKYFENEFYLWWLQNEDTELVSDIKWVGLIVPHYRTKINEIDFLKISKTM